MQEERKRKKKRERERKKEKRWSVCVGGGEGGIFVKWKTPFTQKIIIINEVMLPISYGHLTLSFHLKRFSQSMHIFKNTKL